MLSKQFVNWQLTICQIWQMTNLNHLTIAFRQRELPPRVQPKPKAANRQGSYAGSESSQTSYDSASLFTPAYLEMMKVWLICRLIDPGMSLCCRESACICLFDYLIKVVVYRKSLIGILSQACSCVSTQKLLTDTNC